MSKYFVGDFKVGAASFTVGDRFQSKWDKSIICTLVKIRKAGKKPYTLQHDNGRKVHCDESWLLGMKFLEEKEAMSPTTLGTNAPCLHNLTSAQELVQDSALQVCNTNLTSLEPQRLTNTVAASLDCDIQELTTTATCKHLPTPEHLDCDQEQSTSSQRVLPAPHFPQKGSDLEPPTSETVSRQSLKLSASTNQNSQLSKTSQVCSLVPTSLKMSAVTSGMFYSSFPPSGMMRTGLLSEADTVPLPSLESGYCWLPSPGALSLSGKGRPPGQTKQEGGLKDLGLLQKGEVLNPDILCEWYELPPNWLDPSESRAATELLENKERQQEICLTPELQRSPLTESSTLIPCVESQPLVRDNAKSGTYIINQSESLAIIKDNLGFGFVVDWLASGEEVTYNWERDDRLISGLALAQPAAGIAPQHLINKSSEDNQPQLCTKCFQVVAKSYTCEKCPPIKCTQQSNNVHCPSCESPLITLDNGCGVCGWTPENFLEETQPQPEAVQKPKGRQRKGCLYKYLENKKLKDGTIASYPRVIGHRSPDNPTHWRWGFNWEEKVDGEWKGRSIGSIPVGAIALIQSMQNEGVSLEEIISFIRRAKLKALS